MMVYQMFGRLSSGCLLLSGLLAVVLFVASFLLNPFSLAGAAEPESAHLNLAPSITPVYLPISSVVSSPGSDLSAGQSADQSLVNIFSISPAIARPMIDSVVGVRLNNSLQVDLVDATLRLEISPQVLTTRSALADWVNGEADANTIVIQSELITDFPPGLNRDFFFRIPTVDFPTLATIRGPRPMAVILADANGQTIDQFNSLFIWEPGPTTPTTSGSNTVSVPEPRLNLSFIAPVTGSLINPSQMQFDYEGQVNFLTNYERLRNLVIAADFAANSSGNPAALALAVDPALAALASYSDDPLNQEWLNTLTQAADGGVRIHSLPPFDPDIAALAHADISSYDFGLITNASLPTTWQIPNNWHTPIAWPTDWLTPDLATANTAANSFELFLVPAGMRARFGTLTGLATIPGPNHNMILLINDDRLANSFIGATDPQQVGNRSLADKLQQFLAELVIIREQYPDDPPHLLVALPRDWNPNLGAVSIAFSTLAGADWLNLTALNVLTNEPIPTEERTSLPNWLVHDGELAPNEVQRLVTARANLESYISAAQDPNVLISQAEPLLMLPLSQAWREYYLTQFNRDNPEGLDAATARANMVDHNLSNSFLTAGSMQITASGLTLISDTGSIPLNIHNSLPSAAVVRVVLTPHDSRLLVEDAPLIAIPAGSTLLVYVPVTAIASGDVLVSVELQSESGAIITTTDDLELRIRAGWETVSTGAMTVLLGAMFTGGIIRTYNRNKKRGKADTREKGSAVSDPEIFDRHS